ncbi:hypothetical protein AAHH67_05555 [Niallia circulans]
MRTRKSKKKKIWITLGVIIGILVIGLGSYAFYLFHSVEETANKMYNPLEGDSNSEKKQEKKSLIIQNQSLFCLWVWMKEKVM